MLIGEFAFFIILTAVIVLAFATLYLNFNFSERSLFDKVSAVFLIFLIIHSSYASFVRYMYVEDPFLDIGAPFNLLYPPFFYAAMMVLKKPKHRKLNFIVPHFFPAILFGAFFLLLLVDETFFVDYNAVYLSCLYLCAGIQFISYAVFGFVKFNDSFGSKEIKLVTNYAVKSMILVALIFLSLFFDENLLDDRTYGNAVVIYLFMLFMTILVFRYHVVVILIHSRPEKEEKVLIESLVDDHVPDKTIPVKYEKSRIKEEEGLVYLNRLKVLLDVEKIYLDPDLTIDKLAKKLKITKHHLTQVFTVVLDSNFNKHINQYRVIHASILFKDRKKNASIGDIGTESGFNSRTSFYRGFKAHFGMSPADFKKALISSKKSTS